MKGFNSLASYKNKIAGLVILSIGLLVTIVEKLHPFTVVAKWNADTHLAACIWIIVFGMYMTAFSREKFEDERVKKIRARALQTTMMLLTGTTLAFSLTVITQNLGDLDVMILLMMPAIYLAIYLAMFHIGLYFDEMWDYDEKPVGIIENFKKNKKSIIIFQLLSLAIVFIIYLLLS
ncbi:MAG: hypothetical protein BGO70_07340 [Bacteroidetes bacterium 43-93]|jgi:hypothetical protein|nr:hypothetical protein [Bacteroidota bacterium]OJW97592.1 MAG: hypothetical protein BGO70_07340 [Bacteroidetes bacterium 43-93]